MSTVNLVKYYFYRGTMPADENMLKKLVALAYQTAREKRLYPRAILIRSGIHDTTSQNGRWIKDPKGPHVTLCFKDENQIAKKMHTACHGYVPGSGSFELQEATDEGEKPDSVKRKNGKVVWPDEAELEVAPEVGYSHLEE